MMTKTTLALIVSSTVLVSACSDSNNDTSDMRTVRASFANLDVLGEDYVYEGWLITPSGAVSAGRFESSGAATVFENNASVEDVEVATAYVLTIEPAEDDDPAPAATHVLAGDLISDAAVLSIAHPAAVGQDFTAATGVFGLAVPSDNTGTGSFNNGIWWLQQPGPSAGLSLPLLPDGWVYEGWVVGEDGPISTGRFTDVADADSDGAGETGGSNPGPAFPGQDFINPSPLDLIGLASVISVEPNPDNSLAPFGIKPLIDAEIENVGALPATQPMALVISDNQPTGDIVIQ